MLSDIIARILPRYLLVFTLPKYKVDASQTSGVQKPEDPTKRSFEKKNANPFILFTKQADKSEGGVEKAIAKAIKGHASVVAFSSPKNEENPLFRVSMPELVYQRAPEEAATYRASYTSENNVASYSMYSSYTDVKAPSNDIVEDNGALNPKLDDKAIYKIIQAAKRDNIFGTKTYINPMLKEKFDQWKIFNDSMNKLLYDIISI